VAGLNAISDAASRPNMRAQFRAVIWLRWRMLLNFLRTRRGGFEIASLIIFRGFFALIGLGMGIGLGFVSWDITTHNSLSLLAALLWPVLIVWQVIPIMLASFQENTDLGFFLRFPLNFFAYVLFYLLFGIFDISSITGGIALLGILIGVAAARPSLFFVVFLALTLFAIFNILLTRMIFAWIERWLAQRKTREILGLVFLTTVLSLEFLNPALYGNLGRFHSFSRAAFMHKFTVIVHVQNFLPPGITANALNFIHTGHPFLALANALFLVAYAAVAAQLLILRLRAEYRGESLGQAPAQSAKAVPRRRALDGSGPIAAVIEKELRYLMRSGVMLYQLLSPLFIVFVFSAHSTNPFGNRFSQEFALPLGNAYGFLGLTRFLYNNLGAEGAGIQLYFISPTPFRTILLGKNIVHIGIFCLEAVMVSTLVIIRSGLPSPQILLLTVCWLAFALPVQLAAGNYISITMPYRLNFARMGRGSGSAGNDLLSLLFEVLIVVAGAVIYILLRLIGHPGLAAPVFLVLAAGSTLCWLHILARSGKLLAARKENLIATLYKTA
jgi:ABC-2 type transport system permease protein